MLKNLFVFLFIFLLLCQMCFGVSVVDIEATALREIDPYQKSDLIISDETLENISHKKINEVIQDLPGVSGNEIFNQLFIRGIDSNHIIVIVDNVIINDPSTPGKSCDFGKLKALDVESIQIFKGSRAAIFKEGIGGVILIKTKKMNNKKMEFMLGGGSYDKKIFSTSAGIKKERLSSSLQADFEHTEGKTQREARDHQSERDKNASKQIGFNSIYQIKRDSLIEVVTKFHDRYQEYDSWNQDVPGYYSDEKMLLGNIKYDFILGSKEVTNSLSYGFNKNIRIQNEENKTILNGISNQLLIESKYTLEDIWLIRFEYGYKQDEAKIKGSNAFRKKTDENTFTVISSNVIKKLDWTNSLRLTANELNRRILDYSSSPLFNYNKILQIGSGLSLSHHTPSLLQRFDPVYGNESLKVERSQNYEIFYRLQKGAFKWEQNYYQNQIKDYLSYDSISWKTNNEDRVKIKGLESKIEYKWLDQYEIGASFDRLFTYSYKTRKQLLRRPTYKGTVFFNYDQYLFRWISVGPSDDVEGKNASYHYLDFGYKKILNKQLQIMADVHNLFNEKYREVAGYSRAERTFFVSIKMDVM